ncbi:MAG TPA: DNA mismatch repair protein MutL, partial [Gemmata sp.]
NSKLQYLFVNGRWFRDRSLAHALQESYRGLLMSGRYAIGFLFLTVPPDKIDVNVHPTKSEVRFQENSLVYSLVRATIKQRLLKENLVPHLTVPQGEEIGAPEPEPRVEVPSLFTSPRRELAEQTLAPWERGEIADPFWRTPAGVQTRGAPAVPPFNREGFQPNDVPTFSRGPSAPTYSPSLFRGEVGEGAPARAEPRPPSPRHEEKGADEPLEPENTSDTRGADEPFESERAFVERRQTEPARPDRVPDTPLPSAELAPRTEEPEPSEPARAPLAPVAAQSDAPPSAGTRETQPAEPPSAGRSPGGEPVPVTSGTAIQLHDSYLVIETPDGMLVIDQHALHERILFEQLRRRIRAGQLEIQRLLIPEPIDLPADQAALVLEAADALAELGLEVSDFGGNTILLSSYPTLLGRKAPHVILRGVIDHIVTQERAPTKEALLHLLMATMACKAAVKAGDKLSPEEIAYLLHLRAMAEDSHHCPHGRPTSLLFSRAELDKQFRRT